MSHYFEHLFAHLWNHLAVTSRSRPPPGIELGKRIYEGAVTKDSLVLPHQRRPEHAAILGKTGSGKSSLLKLLASQDIEAGRGFIYFDLHGDTTGFLIRRVAQKQSLVSKDLSRKLIIVEPADPEYSVGLNVLERAGSHVFVQIAEFAKILRQRWGLDHFGPRTEELLRNSLIVLSESGNTLLELGPLLTNNSFRAKALSRTESSEVREYFETRYNQASEAMQAMVRDAVLNKLTAFTADPAFRHILGQQRSTFSLLGALDAGCWIILNLDKGRLGEQATTLGSLFLTKLKNAIFSRKRGELFTIYADEIQNLVTFDSGIDTLLSEARKFSVGVVSANQFLDQYPAQMRSAILAVGTHILFQLSSLDADRMASALSGGKGLSELLKNLPKRHLVAKIGSSKIFEAVVPTVTDAEVDTNELLNRCRARWMRKRSDIEAEIASRRPALASNAEALNDWE